MSDPQLMVENSYRKSADVWHDASVAVTVYKMVILNPPDTATYKIMKSLN